MNKLIHSAGHFLKSNSPVILSGGAIVGTLATAYFSSRAGFRSAQILEKEVEDVEFSSDWERRKEVVGVLWREYIPAAVTGGVTIGCIIFSNKMSTRRVLAATMAYSVTEQAFNQYKEKVVEQIGENKERAIREEIINERVLKKAVPGYVPGEGVLCCEAHTGRYFRSTVEKIRKAENNINHMLNRQDSATLDDFYYMIGLRGTLFSGEVGWNSDKLLDLTFSTVMTEANEPCVSFEYNYLRPLYGGFRTGLCLAE